MIYYRAEIYLPKIGSDGEFETYHIDKSNLLSLDVSIFDRADITLPSFGIISNKGTIEFIDNNPTFSVSRYANLGLLKENANVNVYLVNSRTGKQKKQATMFTASWGYNNDSKTVSVSLKDKLQDWQSIDVSMDAVDVSQNITSTAYSLYLELKAKTPNGSLFLIDTNTENHFKSIQDKVVYFEGGSLWSVWSRFCLATQTHIYSDEEGKIRIIYRGGN